MKDIPVIDVFAGPGGLNEGFSRFVSPHIRFDVRLSIEKDPFACETLRMRSLFRQFNKGGRAPELYYDAVKGDTFAMKRLRETPAWKLADEHVRQWTLGEQDPEDVHSAIRDRLGGRKDWVLLGGPPCQVYSIIGRASMKGTGTNFRSEKEREAHRQELERVFATDHRHTLYRQYLQIVAFHEPALFVMENVKGILSADLPIEERQSGEWTYEPVFERIMADLRNPARAVNNDKGIKKLPNFRVGGKKYRLMSFVKPPDLFGECSNPGDFVIECERYGIPQRRHRVIMLGIREDIDASDIEILERAKELVPAEALLKDFPRIRSSLSKDAETRKEYGDDSDAGWRRAVRESIPKDVLAMIDGKIKKRICQVLEKELDDMRQGGSYVQGSARPSSGPKALRDFIHDPHLGGAIQHESRTHMASDLGRYLYSSVVAEMTKVSPKIDDWPIGLVPNHKNVKTTPGQKKAIVDVFRDRFRVQVWNQPATTVTAHVSKDGHYIIHPDPAQCRSLTVRELARLQTFPDNYYFAGPRTEQYQQVGNAVPPFLAFKLANVVADIIRANERPAKGVAQLGTMRRVASA
jgi:DNA (cytosine-5)-methyltransferase 1